MSDNNGFYYELLPYIGSITGLDIDDALAVAMRFDPDDGVPAPPRIVEVARELGYDVETKHDPADDAKRPLGPEIEMDPAAVLTEVYFACPRVLMSDVPRMGKAPQQYDMDDDLRAAISELPDHVSAAIVNVNLLDGEATFWLHDEANNVDRPIGPIDLRRYPDPTALRDALNDLMKRINLVLAADTN